MANNLEKYIKDTERAIKELDNLSIEDRLQLCASLMFLHNEINSSLTGWAAWLKNPSIMTMLSEEELKEAFETFKVLAKTFLELDVKMSKAVLAKRKDKSRKEQKEEYVS